MKNNGLATFTKVELEFMQIIWDIGEASTEDIQNALKANGRNLTDGGIRTILKVLMNKGHLNRKKKSRSYIYSSKIRKQEAQKSIMHDMLDRVFSGSVPHMVSTLFNSNAISESEIQAVKQIIEDHERSGKK